MNVKPPCRVSSSVNPSMENYQLLIKDYDKDRLGIGNVLKCLITALSINNETYVVCYPEYTYGTYDTILAPRFIYDPSAMNPKKEQVRVNTCRLMLMYYEEAHQEDLPNEETTLDPIHPNLFHWYFSKTKRIDWHYDPNKIHYTVRDRILQSMDKITFTDTVYETVRMWTEQFTASPQTLGLSIRTWKAHHEENVQRPYSFEVYRDKIAAVLQQKPEIQTIVLSVDNTDALGEYIAYLSAHYPTRRILFLGHLPHLNDIQYALCKALTLSACSDVIGNRISTFTELIFWFGRCRPTIHTVY